MAAISLTSDTSHIFDESGFSQIHGMPLRCRYRTNFKVARRHALPRSSLIWSEALAQGTPHGYFAFLITDVLSRAREKLEQGGANIAPRSLPCLASRRMKL